MPVEPPHDRPTTRPAWGRRAAQGSVAALAALTALGAVAPAHAAAEAHSLHAPRHDDAATVTVRPGDSLWSLATAHGVTVAELMAAKDVPAHGMLRPGQRLTLPPSTGQADDDAARESATNAASDTRAASTAGSVPLATAAGTTASRTAESDAPTGPTAAVHTVTPGDTLWDLALRHGVSVADLADANDLAPGAGLRPGQRLTLPGEDATPSGRAASSSQAPSSQKRGDDADGTTTSASGGDTMLGRTYPADVVASADAHRAELKSRTQPSPDEVREMVRGTAQAMGVDPALALAHASQESGFRHGVVSPADAVGTMQVVPAAGQWASDLVGRELDLLDPQDNVTAGVAIIRELQDRAPSRAVGIASYYQGLHGVRTYGMYPDTKEYVKAVSAQERNFAQ